MAAEGDETRRDNFQYEKVGLNASLLVKKNTVSYLSEPFKYAHWIIFAQNRPFSKI